MKKLKSFAVIVIVGLMLCAAVPTVFAWAPMGNATLTIKSYPVGADVYVDGVLSSTKTNCTIKNLAVGSSYAIRVEKAGFTPVTKIFRIWGKAQSYTFFLATPPNIVVTSIPTKATLYVDGQKWAATTPCVLPNLIVGRSYDLVVEKSGYLSMEKKVIAGSGTKSAVFNLQKYKAAVLLIKSSPSGAVVCVNGNFVGTTPYTGAWPSSNEVSLKVEKVGYSKQTKSIYLANGSQYFWQVGLRISSSNSRTKMIP
jgi:hypothetical protein